MKSLITLFNILCVLFSTVLHAQDSIFSSIIDIGGNESVKFAHVTSDHGLLLTGSTDNQIFLLKLDEKGKVEWAKKIGREYPNERLTSGAQVSVMTNSNIVIVGTLNGISYVYMLDAKGDIIWERALSGKEGIGISSITESEFIIVGTRFPPPWQRDPNCDGHGCGGPSSQGEPYYSDLYLAKLDTSGNVLWEDTNPSRGSNPQVLFPLRAGGFAIAGFENTIMEDMASLLKINNDGQIQWWLKEEVEYDYHDLLQAHASEEQITELLANRFSPTTLVDPNPFNAIEIQTDEFLMVGSVFWDPPIFWFDEINISNDRDMLIAIATPTKIKSKSISRSGEQFLYGICADLNNEYIAVGMERPTRKSTQTHLLITRITATGDTIWTRSYPNMGSGKSILKKSDEEFIITGNINGDILVLSVNASGSIITDPTSFQQLIVPQFAQYRENDITGIISDNTPLNYQLFHNYPNPFNLETKITYQVPEVTSVSLVIYDLLGQPIRNLLNIDHGPGSYYVVWDGTDDQGDRVSSGVYFYNFKSKNFTKSHCMVLVK